MGTRIFLGLTGLGWFGYGLFCLLQPEQMASITGLATQTAFAVTELRTMYGGVQMAIGLVALYGALKPASTRWALQFQTVIYLGLAPTRTLSALATGDMSSYTLGGIGFESVCLIIALLLLRRAPQA